MLPNLATILVVATADATADATTRAKLGRSGHPGHRTFSADADAERSTLVGSGGSTVPREDVVRRRRIRRSKRRVGAIIVLKQKKPRQAETGTARR